MADVTAIEWTDSTFNPWIGCTKVGPGCDHCYAAELSRVRLGVPWGPGQPRRRTKPSTWSQPQAWDRRAAREGVRRRVFCASLADVFDNEVAAEWRADLFRLIRETPNLDWLIVTKRIGNATKMAAEAGGWPANVWLGATIVNQAEADRDVPKLLATKGPRFRFLSMEPLLGLVDLRKIVLPGTQPGQFNALTGDVAFTSLIERGGQVVMGPLQTPALDWIIVGGESGRGARPMHPDWARSVRDQCAEAGVPFLLKQWGEWAPDEGGDLDHLDRVIGAPARQWREGEWEEQPKRIHKRRFDENEVYRVGRKRAGRLLDGVQHDGFPQVPA